MKSESLGYVPENFGGKGPRHGFYAVAIQIMRYAFVDTNIFLHFPQLDKVDWCHLLGADRVTLVVAQIVIRQLNEKKDTPGPRKERERAKSSLRWLGQFENDASPQIRKDVDIILQVDDPTLNMSEFRLTPEVEDDWLLAAIVEFSREAPSRNVVFVTDDLGLRLKAKGLNITAQPLPEHLRLPEEEEPAEKRVRELEGELRRLKTAMPDLCLEFAGGEKHHEVRLQRAPELNPQSARERVDELKRQCPKLSKPTGYSGADLARGVVLNPEEIDEYNRKLDFYYGAYEKYLDETWHFEVMKWGTIKLQIYLANHGTAPAKDVDILMHFPDGFDLLDEEGLPEALVKPSEPQKPLTRLEEALEGLQSLRESLKDPLTFGLQIPDFARPMEAFDPNAAGWTIKRGKSYDVETHASGLKHNLVWPLDPLYVIFSAREAVKSFAVAYELLAGNVPQKVEGALHVVIKTD